MASWPESRMNARESSARPDSAFPVSEAGLYLHVPFCLRKCPYCNFYSQATASDEVKNHYVDAVIRQISRFSSLELLTSCKVNTLFFGGGTPSILPAPTLGQLLNRCCESFGCMDDALEISIEVNPATIDLAGLFELRASGFNRISIGAQSFSDRELKRIGRLHDAEDIIRIVRQARTVGFKNLNIDLMYGLPGQSVKQWRNNLEMALALEPDHLSLYELTLEENTPFFKMAAQGELNLPPEDAVLAMLEETGQKLRGAGFIRYEISNYAKPGWECRHNINYWNNGSYIGLGASAVS
jgi:oxygen-independent coproporphyrinogen-3 oxidase